MADEKIKVKTIKSQRRSLESIEKEVYELRFRELPQKVLEADMQFRLNARRNGVNFARAAWGVYSKALISTISAELRNPKIYSLHSFLEEYPEIKEGTSLEFEETVKDCFPYFKKDICMLAPGYLSIEGCYLAYSLHLTTSGLSNSGNPLERDKEFFKNFWSIETPADKIINNSGLLEVLKEEKIKIEVTAKKADQSHHANTMLISFLNRLNGFGATNYNKEYYFPEIFKEYEGLSESGVARCANARKLFENAFGKIDKVNYNNEVRIWKEKSEDMQGHPFVKYLEFRLREL